MPEQYLVVDVHRFDARRKTAQDFNPAFRHSEMFGEQLDDGRIRFAVDGPLLNKNREGSTRRSRLIFNERTLAAPRFYVNSDLHDSRLAGGTETGRHLER